MVTQLFSSVFVLTAINAGARHLGLKTDHKCWYVLCIKHCSLVKKMEKCRRLDPLRLYLTTLNEYGIQVYHNVSLKKLN